MKQEITSKKLWFSVSAFLVLLGIWVIFVSNGNISQSLLSQFSGTNITPSNASSLWRPSTGNPNRIKITESTAARLDPVITRMLARGATLTADGYQIYLNNVVEGIGRIAAQSKYAGNTDVQNMVSYISFELTDAKTLMANNNNIVSEITNFFEGNEVMSGATTTGSSSTTPSNLVSTAVSEVMNGGSFAQMFTSALNSETLNQGGVTEEPVCPNFSPPEPNSNYCPPSKVIASTTDSYGCTVPPSCSQEATVNVNEWYSQVLGRTSDSAGATYWFGILNQTNNVSQTFASFVASARGVAGETVNTAAVTALTQKYSDPKYR